MHTQQSPPPIVTTASKGTNGQDSTSLSISPLPGSDKLVNLGYNIGADAGTGTDLTGKSNTNAKSSTDKKDNDSDTGNNSTNPSSHTDDRSKSKPSPKSKDHNDNEAGAVTKRRKAVRKETKVIRVEIAFLDMTCSFSGYGWFD